MWLNSGPPKSIPVLFCGNRLKLDTWLLTYFQVCLAVRSGQGTTNSPSVEVHCDTFGSGT